MTQSVAPGGNQAYYWTRQGISLQELQKAIEDLIASVPEGGGSGGGGTGGAVASVAGKTGVVLLDRNDVGLGEVNNTRDSDKPVSTATQNALATRIPVPAGGADGALLAKSSSNVAYWSNLTEVTVVKSSDSTVSNLIFVSSPPTGTAPNGTFAITPA